jgi:hypothetical protein
VNSRTANSPRRYPDRYRHRRIAIIVNNDNPISGLTAEQVRQIYVGEMLNWAEVQ